MIKFLKRCWIILAGLIITAAILSSLFRALTPWAKGYKTEVEQQLSSALGQKVTIKEMETGWYWFEPVVKLNQISISDGNEVAVQLSNLLIGINVFSSIWHWQIQPGILLIEDLHLGLHQKEGYWQIDGIDGLANHQLNWDLASYQPLFVWILGQQKIIIKNLSAQIYMQDGTLIPLSKLNLKIANHSGHYYIKGKGALAQTTSTHFKLLADLILDPYALNEATGKVFFAVRDLLPVQWLGFMPQTRFQLQDGRCNLQMWADLAKGKLKLAQAKLDLNHFAWLDKQTQKNQLIQNFNANLAWKPANEGWFLAADRVHLQLEDKTWPENSFKLSYQKSSQAYSIFVKTILVESLLNSSLSWPEKLTAILAAKPRGNLYDTQIQFKPSGIDYLLTRFSGLSWQGFKQKPGLENLSGALLWQPRSGRLSLDSENLIVKFAKQKPLKFSAIDASFDWQQKNGDWSVNLDHFIVNHPNLLLSANGIIDNISSNSPGQLKLKAEFSGKDAQYFLPYVPGKHLKPKFDAWLKHDVKRIRELSGELMVNGAITDFPFDKQVGDFQVNTHLKGVDLAFAKNWPLAKDLEAFLRVNKRNLEADIVHSNLAGIIDNNANLRIDDIGFDRENLLFRTQSKVNATKLLNLLMNSPLKQKLSALAMMELQGLLKLDLKLEAPLYPQNDKILALGELNFQNNKVTVHHSLDDIDLTKLSGNLTFDQEGVLDSDLKAMILNSPARFIIKSIHEPNPYTEIKITGKTSAEALYKKLNFPILTLMHGSLGMESTLKLTDDPKAYSHLSLQTSLEGLAINLPPPLGKAAETKSLLTLDLSFNAKKALNLRFNYDNRLSSDLSFSSTELKKGEIRLGSDGPKLKANQKGLQLVGSLASFDLQSWLDTKAKLFKIEEKNRLFDALNLIDLKLTQAKIWNENYKDLTIKAKKLTEDDWSLQLNEESLDANLNYQPKTNTIKGNFAKLGIKSSYKDQKDSSENSSLKPKDIPNLDLHIDSLQLGEMDLGEMNLKTKSLNKRWRLESCEMKSPSYLLNLKGDWLQSDKKNTTKIQAAMQINDLAASLERLKISPALEAKKGEIQFQGGWMGGLADFQLAKLKGELKIDFKNGRITNLSPETEEKLGLGKLLSILSLQTIPRRLKLDFSDLSKGGYSFDKFEGNFELGKGILTTQDSYIDGPVAYASMKGKLDIAKQNYDVDLKISPHITASLPVVATIAGGPVIGFATLVASKIINQGMHNISAYTYKVTGPWQKPVVKQVSIKKRQVPFRG